MPTPWSSTSRRTSSSPTSAGEADRAALVGELHRVLEQVVERGDELAAVAEDGHGRVGLLELDLDVALVGRGAHALDRLGHHEVHQDRLARRRFLRLDPRQVEEVVDDPADPEGLGVDPAGQARRHRGVGLRHQGLGQQAERAHRGLELVADVGHEVAADLLEAPALGDVLDHGDDAQRAAAVVDDLRAHRQGAPGRAVEVEGALGRPWRPGVGQEVDDGLGRQGVAVAAAHEAVGPGVAEDHLAALVADHDALGEGVEGPAEADGVGRGLGHRLGGPVGDLLEVVEGGLDPGGSRRAALDAEPGGERRQPLLEGVAPRAPAQERGHDDPHHRHGTERGERR